MRDHPRIPPLLAASLLALALLAVTTTSATPTVGIALAVSKPLPTARVIVVHDTAIPLPTLTSQPTATPTEVPSPSPTPALMTTKSNGDVCYGPLGVLCFPFKVIGGIAGGIGQLAGDWSTNWFAHEWSTGVDTFAPDLQTLPDLPNDPRFVPLQGYETGVQEAAGVLGIALMTLAVWTGSLFSLGKKENASAATEPIVRCLVVIGFIAGYHQIMSLLFTALGAINSVLASAPLGHDTGITALANVFTDAQHAADPLLPVTMIVGYVCALLADVTKQASFGVEDVLYVCGPFLMACYIFPPLAGIARLFWLSFIGIAIMPLMFTIALKVIGVTLGPGSSLILALAMAVFLLSIPAWTLKLVGGVDSRSGVLTGAIIGAGERAVSSKLGGIK